MKNKILLTLLVSLFLVNSSFSQEQNPVKIHEIGLTFANFDNFGIRYKTGSDKTLLRITFLSMNLNLNNNWGKDEDSTSHKSSGYGTGFRIGFEKPIVVVKNFNLFYGLDLVGSFNFQTYKDEYPSIHYESTTWAVSPGIAFVFGGSYDLGEHFRFSAEISPSLRYIYQNDKSKTNEQPEVTTQSSNVTFGLYNYGASITVAYRFIK